MSGLMRYKHLTLKLFTELKFYKTFLCVRPWMRVCVCDMFAGPGQ